MKLMAGQTQAGFTEADLKKLAADILEQTQKQGATSAEVDIGANKGFSVTVRQGEVETVAYHQDKTVDITVYFGQRAGSASLSDIRPEAIQSAVQAACHIARFTDEDEYGGLAEKNLLAFDYPILELAYPWELTVEQAIEMAKASEAAGLNYNKKITQSEGVNICTTEAWEVYANTEGFTGIFPVTRHEVSCSFIAGKGDGMQRDGYYTTACDAALLESTEAVALEGAHRTIKRLNARCLTTRRSPIILSAEIARGLIGHFMAAISGGQLYRKASFLLDHLGKMIFPAHVTIQEHPHLNKALGSAPFDDDGVATRQNFFIKQGVLENYSLGVYSARKLGLQTTGNAGGAHNILVSSGNKNLSDLLKTMNTGLLVTELMGQGVNLITGDYSRGAAGFWVEKGELQYPVEEITIAGNLRDMYAGLIEVGMDIDKRGNVQTGSILLDNMMIAGH
jgi:PmbA protein